MPPSMGGQHSSITINNGISNGKSNSGSSVGKNKGPKKHFSLFDVKIELKRYCIQKNRKNVKKKKSNRPFHEKFEL